MPKVHHIKANKDYPDEGIKKGEMYFKWSLKTGPRSGMTFRSKSHPRQSQLTTSDFWSTFYGISEQAEDLIPSMDDVETERDNVVQELESLRDETQSRFDNMPDGLQQGETGQRLENRVSELESLIESINSVDCTCDDGDEDQSEEEKEERRSDRAKEIWEEIVDELSGFSCD